MNVLFVGDQNRNVSKGEHLPTPPPIQNYRSLYLLLPNVNSFKQFRQLFIHEFFIYVLCMMWSARKQKGNHELLKVLKSFKKRRSQSNIIKQAMLRVWLHLSVPSKSRLPLEHNDILIPFVGPSVPLANSKLTHDNRRSLVMISP